MVNGQYCVQEDACNVDTYPAGGLLVKVGPDPNWRMDLFGMAIRAYCEGEDETNMYESPVHNCEDRRCIARKDSQPP